MEPLSLWHPAVAMAWVPGALVLFWMALGWIAQCRSVMVRLMGLTALFVLFLVAVPWVSVAITTPEEPVVSLPPLFWP